MLMNMVPGVRIAEIGAPAIGVVSLEQDVGAPDVGVGKIGVGFRISGI